MTCVIARAWATVARHRFDHFYGHEYARITREQRRLELPERSSSIWIKFYSIILFHFPANLEAEFEALPTDNLVYAIHWRKFVTSLTNEWRDISVMSAALLVANSGLLGAGRTPITKLSGLASTLCSIGGVSCSLALMHKYSGNTGNSADTAAIHLQEIQDEDLGYGPVATAYSVPKGALVWSLVFLTLEVLGIIVEFAGIQVAIGPAVMLALVGVYFIGQFLCQQARKLRARLRYHDDTSVETKKMSMV